MKIKSKEEGSQKTKEEAWRNMMLGLCLLFMSTIYYLLFISISYLNPYSIYNLYSLLITLWYLLPELKMAMILSKQYKSILSYKIMDISMLDLN